MHASISYVTEEGGASKTEYDFTGDYHIVSSQKGEEWSTECPNPGPSPIQSTQ